MTTVSAVTAAAWFCSRTGITYTRDDGTTVTPRELNKQRQETILKLMYEQGYIQTEAEYEAAVNEELHFIEREGNADETLQQDDKDQQYQSYFVDQVRRDVTSDLMELWGLDKKATETKLLSGGYRIYTTMDPDIQAIAESVYADRGNLKNLTSASGQLIRSGITIVDVTNGNVVAMVGDMGEKTGDMVWNYAIGTMYMDIIQECEKLGDYVVNVVEARMGVRPPFLRERFVCV